MAYLKKIQRSSGKADPTEPRPLSPTVSKTLQGWEAARQPDQSDDVAYIEVHDTISNVAWAYEKLRQAIDYQDEHLLRKNAIERILKRRLISGVTAEQISEPLVLELIRGRYLPNNGVPVTKIDEAQIIINQYINLWSQVPALDSPREAERLFEWMVGLMAVELNEIFAASTHNELLVNLMFQVTHQDISVADEQMSEDEKNTLIYIAIHRALLKSDSNIIRYHLLLREHPEWQTADELSIHQLGQNLLAIRDRIEGELLHPAGELIQRLMKKYTILFLILDDIQAKHGAAAADLLTQPDEVIKEVQAAYAARRKTVTWKIARNIVRSIIYIFLTKMLLTLLVELPLDRLFYGQDISLTPLAINTIFPPLLLLFIAITIRPPGKKNEQAVVQKFLDLIYRSHERHVLVKPRKPIRRNAVFTFFYRVIYAVIFVIVFGGIITVLTTVGFTPISTFIFILFLTIVSFFGIRVRLLAKELLLVDQRENIFTVIFDFFTVPILQVGRWISLRVPRVNLLIFFLDVIIEAPFKATLSAVEGFLGFLREKREEIY